ncbi:MAG: hypothetical protein NTV51_29080 [Verrucomicrobia bacterium]|nr:hypothetical protein [Verrucomicrobiota bacterium]
MIVIRRMVDRHRAYTAIFLKGEPPKIFPTSDAEHARILQVYKQDRPHEGILNDFSEIDAPAPSAAPPAHAAPAPWPLAPQPKASSPKKRPATNSSPRKSTGAARSSRPQKAVPERFWLVPVGPKE